MSITDFIAIVFAVALGNAMTTIAWGQKCRSAIKKVSAKLDDGEDDA